MADDITFRIYIPSKPHEMYVIAAYITQIGIYQNLKPSCVNDRQNNFSVKFFKIYLFNGEKLVSDYSEE